MIPHFATVSTVQQLCKQTVGTTKPRHTPKTHSHSHSHYYYYFYYDSNSYPYSDSYFDSQLTFSSETNATEPATLWSISTGWSQTKLIFATRNVSHFPASNWVRYNDGTRNGKSIWRHSTTPDMLFPAGIRLLVWHGKCTLG